MANKEELFATVKKLRIDCAVRQKKGLHFIVASVLIWFGVLLIHASALPIENKNFYTFVCSAPLMPLAMMIAKLFHIDFKSKDNPLTELGIMFSVNQMIYLLIAMWVYAATPEKFLMVYSMIFGAHLLPYGWLYGSKSYFILSVLIPIASLLIGLIFSPVVLAAFMLIEEIGFCLLLTIENKKLAKKLEAEAYS